LLTLRESFDDAPGARIAKHCQSRMHHRQKCCAPDQAQTIASGQCRQACEARAQIIRP
jgi:hypothetical protein